MEKRIRRTPETDNAQLVAETARRLEKKLPAGFVPQVAIVLGSGLGMIPRSFRALSTIPYIDLPGLSVPSVHGHKGEIIAGVWQGKKVLILSGRVHYYEGYSLNQVTFPIRVLARLGIDHIILTAAVGGVHSKFKPGDLALITDHINGMGGNPLRGLHDSSFGERFPDMSVCYSKKLSKIAEQSAKLKKIPLHGAVYWAVPGPSYETPAEVRMIEKLGGDVVGMSLVPEAIVARQMRMNVLALAIVSNLAAGKAKKELSHQEVLAVGKVSGKRVFTLLEEVLKKLPN